ncbi:MAG: glycosyltransferase family 4 protein [Nitrospira sp.]|nr:glycosyltransferase family 4 protein [Nitrospira sp.]
MISLMLFVLSFLVSWRFTIWLLHRAERLRLVQAPTLRSSHVQPIPTGGGLGIVIASTVAGVWLAWGQSQSILIATALAVPLALVGLLDDIRHLSARVRLGVQVAVCTGLLIALGSVPEITVGNVVLGGLALSGMILLVGVWWINLFNFMDGIDGIAGVQAVFMLLAGAALTAWGNPDATGSPLWVLMPCVVAATVGFLLLNWPPAKIFMGDTGSTWLGFMIFALALLTIQSGWLSYAVWLVLGAAFISDATVTLLTRMARGERWYEAHCNHAYQRLARRWQGERNAGHRSVVLLFAMVNLLWLAPIAWACMKWPQWIPGLVILAYAPLVMGTLALGAGKPE